MSRPGPKHKPDRPRYSCGQIKHGYREPKQESPEKVRSVVMNQPHRRIFGEEKAGSQYAGYAYGRLFLTGAIDEKQHMAAEIFTKRELRYMRHIVGRTPNITTGLSLMVKMDLELQREQEREQEPQATERWRLHDEIELDEEERAKRILEDRQEIQLALAEHGMHHIGNVILTRVCISDRGPQNEEELGAFRSALNLIARRLRL